MKIKILRSTIADGKRVEKGKTVEVSDKDARTLINMKKAVSAEKKAEKKADKGGE